jgi:hypothetical protein
LCELVLIDCNMLVFQLKPNRCKQRKTRELGLQNLYASVRFRPAPPKS